MGAVCARNTTPEFCEESPNRIADIIRSGPFGHSPTLPVGCRDIYEDTLCRWVDGLRDVLLN